MILKKTVLFLLILSCFSCFGDKVAITSDRRIQVKGSISNPFDIPELEIYGFAGGDRYYFGYASDYRELGGDQMKPDGSYDFMVLDPKRKITYLAINTSFSETYSEGFESVYILVESFRDYLIEVPSLELRKTAEIQISFRNVSETEELEYEVLYSGVSTYLKYNNSELLEMEESETGFSSVNGLGGLLTSGENHQIQLESLEGKTVTVVLYYGNEPEERTFIIEPGIENYQIAY